MWYIVIMMAMLCQKELFAQAEYNKDKLSAFLAGSISNTGYWRYDRFYYDKQHAESETVNFIGYTVKGGANYNLNEYHNVFANVGYISRAPFLLRWRFSYRVQLVMLLIRML